MKMNWWKTGEPLISRTVREDMDELPSGRAAHVSSFTGEGGLVQRASQVQPAATIFCSCSSTVLGFGNGR